MCDGCAALFLISLQNHFVVGGQCRPLSVPLKLGRSELVSSRQTAILKLSLGQVSEDAVAGVVLHQREEALQEVRQRRSAEDSVSEAPGGAQRTFTADR